MCMYVRMSVCLSVSMYIYIYIYSHYTLSFMQQQSSSIYPAYLS